jgi:hypothetical protein
VAKSQHIVDQNGLDLNLPAPNGIFCKHDKNKKQWCRANEFQFLINECMSIYLDYEIRTHSTLEITLLFLANHSYRMGDHKIAFDEEIFLREWDGYPDDTKLFVQQWMGVSLFTLHLLFAVLIWVSYSALFGGTARIRRAVNLK